MSVGGGLRECQSIDCDGRNCNADRRLLPLKNVRRDPTKLGGYLATYANADRRLLPLKNIRRDPPKVGGILVKHADALRT